MENASLANSIRNAVRQSGRTPYAISKDAGVHLSTLSRFLRGDGMSISNLEAIVEALDCKLLIVKGGCEDVEAATS